MTLAKAHQATPMGAVMLSDEIYQATPMGSPRRRSATDTRAHPVSAIALEVLRIYEEGAARQRPAQARDSRQA